MSANERHACRVCARADLSLTANGRVRSHTANGRRPGPDNPSCPGGGDLPQQDGLVSARGSEAPAEAIPAVPTADARERTPAMTAETDVFVSAPEAQPEPKRDRYGRYRLTSPHTGKEQSWTRATTFAKSISDTFALSQWSQRMTLKGCALRPDLVSMAHTLRVKEDRDQMNSLVEQAKDAAGQKVSANLGTALHSLTEAIDRGEQDSAVPPQHVVDVRAYTAVLRSEEISIVPDLIERVTAVPQFDVAGTFDRVLRLPNGEHVIGDLKGLALTERIPTPDGWTTMGEISVGDSVFDAYGKPCTVTAKSQTKWIGTYIVRFDDGSSVVCDTEHIWWTTSGTSPGEPTAKPISEIIATLRGSNGRLQHRVPLTGPLELPDAELPIDPYLLGCWLGGRAVLSGLITNERDLFETLASDGHVLGREQPSLSKARVSRIVAGLTRLIWENGLQNNKHIPGGYLRASTDQRLRLLQGLMDTNGTWNTARRTAVFSSTDKALAFQVEELLLSLGQRPHVAEVSGRGLDRVVISYHVSFAPVDLSPFRLPRKADQAAASKKPSTRSGGRLIVAVDPGPDVETACIAVDSQTRTYLCGDRMVPTHNTGADLQYGWQEIAIQLALYARGMNECGVYDLRENRWDLEVPKVRTDFGIVMHLPVGKATCTLYKVDLNQGWAAATLCHSVREWRKRRTIAEQFTMAEVQKRQPQEVVVVRPPTWEERFSTASSRGELAALFEEMRSAELPEAYVTSMVQIGRARLAVLEEPAG